MFSPLAVIRRIVKESRLREKYEGGVKPVAPPTPLTPLTPLKPLKPLKVEKPK